MYENEDSSGSDKNSAGQSSSLQNQAKQMRAKLYLLDERGQWSDQGTGYFRIDLTKDKEGQALYKMSLLSEDESGMDLLNNEFILPHIQFSKQRCKFPIVNSLATIITWADKERQQDLAVSFQNVEGAKQVWNKIKKICQMLGIDIDQNSQQSQA
jgi:hypothetical protein